MAASGQKELQTTPLFKIHQARGAKMVEFAGYSMPVQYPMGILKEHLHSRSAVGIFDVSHMGQIILRPKSGAVDNAARALERLSPADFAGLAPGRQRYGLLTNDQGGVDDDFMAANRGDHLFLVVNAACKHADFERFQFMLSDACDVQMIEDRGLIALQGPKAEDAMRSLGADLSAMRFMDVADRQLAGVACIVSRSGYTGEDGFEISMPQQQMPAVFEALCAHEHVEPIGLGARDSLRLEAGLCLYGTDLDARTSPVEASLAWSIGKARRTGGAREGGFTGAELILEQLKNGVNRKRVGLKPEGRAPIRGGAALFASEGASAPIGVVSSGGFGPSVGGPVAMGYVSAVYADAGSKLFAQVRGKRLPLCVSELPFVQPGFKRS